MQACTPNQSMSPHTPRNSGLQPRSGSRPDIDPRDISPDDKEIITTTCHTINSTIDTVQPINLEAPPQGWNWETVVTDPEKRVEICKTRSGRSVKPPVRYEPVEEVEDDNDDCADGEESGVYDDEMCSDSDEEEEEDDDGSYDGSFINDEESDYDVDEDDIEEEIEEEEDEDEYTDTESEEDDKDEDDEDDEDDARDGESVGDNDKNMMDYYRSKKPRVRA